MQGSAESVGEDHYPPKYQLAEYGLNRGQDPAPATIPPDRKWVRQRDFMMTDDYQRKLAGSVKLIAEEVRREKRVHRTTAPASAPIGHREAECAA